MAEKPPLLEHEEYIEQAYFFRAMIERLDASVPIQELIGMLGEEILATTNLPLALDFMRAEVLHAGTVSTAMQKLPHYFSTFQTYIMIEAENERGRFDMRTALAILRAEADYRSKQGSRQGMFLFQFETLSRNRLNYDRGLLAMAEDSYFDQDWTDWLLFLRRQIGLIDLADMIFIRSEYYLSERQKKGLAPPERPQPILLFGSREGRIAMANRRKEPLYLFAALQRQLGYPIVPRLEKADKTPELIPQLLRRMERLEARIKLLEQEQLHGGLDITKFY